MTTTRRKRRLTPREIQIAGLLLGAIAIVIGATSLLVTILK